MNLEHRMKVKILWLAKWSAEQIAEFINEPVSRVEELIAIYAKGQG